jgi:hypothetical protein
VAELVERHDPLRRRGAAGHGHDPDGLDVAVPRLGQAERGAAQRRPSRSDGVDRVGLAGPVARLAVRAIDLDDTDPGLRKMPGQPGS